MSNDSYWPDEYTLCVHLARLYPDTPPGHIAANVHRIKRRAGRLRNLFVRQCNEGQRDGDDKAIARVAEKVRACLSEISGSAPTIPFEINHDPRGRAIKLALPEPAGGYRPGNDLSGLWGI